MRRAWGLGPHQKITPGYAEKLCFTVTATGSDEEAAQVASRWAGGIDDATRHALVQRVGARAERPARSRYEPPPQERLARRGRTELGVIMVGGCPVRYRGAGWGKKKTQQLRVEGHELKLGLFYRHAAAARTEAGRGILSDKVGVSWQDPAMGLGQRRHWEAPREGLGRARNVRFLGDGAEWVWNLKKDRWPKALELLDFYHGSQHLWSLGRALRGETQPALSRGVKPLRHKLRRGQEQKALRQMARLRHPPGEAGEIIRREQNSFQSHAERVHYQRMARRGWPIGSGAVESACRQKQTRFKRCGQFWTPTGLRNLCALDEARRNHPWDELWASN